MWSLWVSDQYLRVLGQSSEDADVVLNHACIIFAQVLLAHGTLQACTTAAYISAM